MPKSVLVPQLPGAWIQPNGQPTPAFYRFILSLTNVAGGNAVITIDELESLVLTARSPEAGLDALANRLAMLEGQLTARGVDLTPLKRQIRAVEAAFRTQRGTNLNRLDNATRDGQALDYTRRDPSSGRLESRLTNLEGDYYTRRATPPAAPSASGGTPGGTNGQIQYNNAGAFGGFTASGDATINTATGAVTIASSVNLTGSPTTTTQAASDNSTKIATTAYVTTGISNAIAGVNPAVAVQAATTAAADTSSFTYNNGVSGVGATLTGPTANVAVTIDGFTFTTLGQRLLVKNDTQSPSGAFNGVYYVTTLQAPLIKPVLTRALDYDMPSDINNTGAIPVVNGTVNAGTSWLLTSTVNTVGTDPLTYVQFTVAPTNTVQTGGTNPTNHSLLLGKGTNVVGSLGAATNGQIPIGSTGADPVLATITQGAGISVSNAAGSITITNTGSPGTGSEVLISEVVTSGSQANVTFSSIAATYRDLVVRVRGRTSPAAGAVNIQMQLNGDTGSNYDTQTVQGASSAASANGSFGQTSSTAFQLTGSTATAGWAGGGDMVFYDYRGTTFAKVGAGASYQAGASTLVNFAFQWRSTAAINAVKLFPTSGNFVDGSVVSLYGRY